MTHNFGESKNDLKKQTVIVIATYNEANTIAQILAQLRDYYKVIIVDDNSPDSTGNIAKCFDNTRVFTRVKKRGIATAYLKGFNVAIGYDVKYVVQMDAGLTHDPQDIPRLLATAVKCPGLVIGSRFVTGKKLKSYRTLISLGAAWLMRRLGISVCDATSGFRVWPKDLLARIIKQKFGAQGFAFQLEMLFAARHAAISECPIEYKLTNSSFNLRTLLESLWVYGKLLQRYFYEH